MAKYQVPESLIGQLQILLRKEASLESFNPNDPSIPPPPTIEDAIAGIGTSNDQFRCKHCRGELLRGAESIICVYCGERQQQGTDPQPVAYKSTLAFEWLLHSLRLDGSETIGPVIGDTQCSGGQSSLRNEIALSDFLNLELKWADESKRFGLINEAQHAGERSSTLVGMDLNELSHEGIGDNISCINNEQTASSKQIEIEETATSSGQRSLNLFDEKQSSESVLGPNEGENDESFSGWEAEFQSAVPDAVQQNLQSFETGRSPPVDGASHIDSMQGITEVEKSIKISLSHAHPQRDLTNDVLEVDFTLASRLRQSEGSISVEDVSKYFESADASGFNRPTLDDQQKTAVVEPFPIESTVGGDSFDDWNDFRISTDVKNNQCEPSTTTQSGTENTRADLSDEWKDSAGSAGESNPPTTNAFGGPGDDDDVWNDFMVSSSAGNNELKTAGSDVYQQEKQHAVSAPQNRTSNKDDSMGLWSTGISKSILDDQLPASETKSPVTKDADDSFDLWDDFKSSAVETQQAISIEGSENISSGNDDTTNDILNDFASLGVSKNEQQISGEKATASSLASQNNNSFNAWDDLASVTASKPVSDDISFGEWNDFSSLATVTDTNQNQSSGIADGQTVRGDDNSFSSWSNLGTSEAKAENSFPSAFATVSNLDYISTGETPESPKITKDNSTFDDWSDFGQSILMPKEQSQAGGMELSEKKLSDGDNELFSGWSGSGEQSIKPPGNQFSINGVLAHDSKSISADDSFDAWSYFTGSGNVTVDQSLSSFATAPVGKEAGSQDDIFGSWNMYESSSSVENAMAPKENLPEISLFSTNTNSQGAESNSSLQQDLLFEAFSSQNVASQEAVLPPNNPVLVRTENGSGNADDFEQTNQSEAASKGTSNLKSSDVEKLLSEMHDLSFMLENSLSVPESGQR